MGDLTANFSRAEFDRPEVYPDALVADHLVPLVARAQWLRDLAGSPGIVDDTYRSQDHNNAIVGASSTSQHMDGDATDVYFPLISIRELASRALGAIADGTAPAFGQLIFYSVKGHVHVSNPADRLGDRNGQVLECTGADATGADQFVPLTDAAQLPVYSTAQKKTAPRSLSLSCSSSLASSGDAPARED